MESNGVNYYKGVLLCSRPNQSPSIPKQKPFCGRVTPHEQIGLVPTKNFDQPKTRKRQLPVLNNHKKWLKEFKEKLDDQKKGEEEQKQKQVDKLEKIKQEGARQRQSLRNSENTSIINQIETPKESVKLPPVEQSTRMKKGKKPVWAKTDQEIEQEQEKQVDDLIDFFETAEVKDYADDDEVKKMLEDLKVRIEEMKNQGNEENGNWKNKQMQKIREQKETKSEKQKEKRDDILSRISRDSGSQSVASQKTTERVEQLNKKKQQKQWDKFTSSEKRAQASVDEQIAKNVADQILRNYPALKHLSNQSVRKILEKQAHEQIKA